MASEAHAAFERNCESISSLIRCADVFGLHALALLRSQPPDVALIERIITEGGVSQLAYSWQWFMKGEEREAFGEKGHLRAICENIVFASYVAVEAYLQGKFKEYFAYLYKAPSPVKMAALQRRISLRNLKELNEQFDRYLDIPLARFNHSQVSTFEEASWFHPSSCWAGLVQLEECRNELAHAGRMESARLVVLVDAWSAFEFCRSYAQLFEAAYNARVYDGRSVKYEEPKS